MTSQPTLPPGLEDSVRALLPAGTKVHISNTGLLAESVVHLHFGSPDRYFTIHYHHGRWEQWVPADAVTNKQVTSHLQAAAQVADWLNANWKPE